VEIKTPSLQKQGTTQGLDSCFLRACPVLDTGNGTRIQQVFE